MRWEKENRFEIEELLKNRKRGYDWDKEGDFKISLKALAAGPI